MLRTKQIALTLNMAWGFVPSVSLVQQTHNSKIVNTPLEEITVRANHAQRRADIPSLRLLGAIKPINNYGGRYGNLSN